MDSSSSVNPTFASFHRVHFHYCDGSSYLGDRSEPLVVEGQPPLYFRGRRVLEALVALTLELGLRNANEVLFSGGSAGGIGALHAAGWIRPLVPGARRFKVLIASGFF